jgi:hypothetical protein
VLMLVADLGGLNMFARIKAVPALNRLQVAPSGSSDENGL